MSDTVNAIRDRHVGGSVITISVQEFLQLEEEIESLNARVAELEAAVLNHKSYMQRFSEGKEPHLAHDRELYAVLDTEVKG